MRWQVLRNWDCMMTMILIMRMLGKLYACTKKNGLGLLFLFLWIFKGCFFFSIDLFYYVHTVQNAELHNVLTILWSWFAIKNNQQIGVSLERLPPFIQMFESHISPLIICINHCVYDWMSGFPKSHGRIM